MSDEPEIWFERFYGAYCPTSFRGLAVVFLGIAGTLAAFWATYGLAWLIGYGRAGLAAGLVVSLVCWIKFMRMAYRHSAPVQSTPKASETRPPG